MTEQPGQPDTAEITVQPGDTPEADTARRHWNESLWHRAPTPQYRP